MDAMGVQRLQRTLEEELHSLGVETAYLEGGADQLGRTLRALLPVTEAGEVVLMELMAGELDQEHDILIFYTTLIAEIGPGYEAFKGMLLDWNLRIPLGAFGIYREGRQFYHKYALPFPKEETPEALAGQAMYLIRTVADVISVLFPDISRISG